MTTHYRPVRIAYLLPDQFWSSTVTSAIEVFHGMGLHSKAFSGGEFRGFDISLLRTTRKRVRGFSGFNLDTRCFADHSLVNAHFDAVIIPSIWNLSLENLQESQKALEWLRHQHSEGAIVAGLVTGVFYLAEAGLLQGRDATVHWASINIFKQRYPDIKVAPRMQMIEADRVITTSSTPATFDVALLLIQRFLGDRLAEYASNYFTIRDKDAPLPVFLEPSSQDRLVDAACDLLRMHYAAEITLTKLADQLNVSARTLSRRFVAATGMNPIQYLTKKRLNAARDLLQSTDLQIQQVAERSGFGSSTLLSRNFKKEYSQTPRDYRKSLPLAQ